MNSEYSIMLDFQQAKARADELDEIASQIKNLTEKDFEADLQVLSKAWQGEAANQFLKKGILMKNKMLETAKSLNETAKTIRSTAKRTYDAEMRALELAKQREYLLSKLNQ